jgi:hypothetical protein
MSDGFLDFTIGEGDSRIGKKTKRFKAESNTSYRVSFVWYTDLDENGVPTENANPKFTGCERIYKNGVGYVLIKDTNRSAMIDLLKSQPKQAVATIICVWPTNKDGDLDTASFKSGKGWEISPWIFSADKYKEIGRNHKRFPLTKHDLSMSCSDATYQKLTFTPEGENLFVKLMDSGKEEHIAIAKQILVEVERCAQNIHRDLARELSTDDVREALGETLESPTGSHSATDVDDMLNDIL